MKRTLTFYFTILLALLLQACAHPITMAPDLAQIKSQGAPVIDKVVGYHIPEAKRTLEVTTPGGGGDKVRYFPYRDLEPGLYKALSETFKNVTPVTNPKDEAGMRNAGVSLLITPEISTMSYSDSIVTWPPTWVTITLVCSVADAQGKPVHTLQVSGEGRATFDEFKSNLSLAAVRAANDVMAKLVKALGESPELRR